VGPLYLFALVVGLGVLVAQLVLGGKEAGDAATDGGADASAESGSSSEPHGHAEHAAAGAGLEGLASLTALFASTRFWIFALLAFGLSGSLLHYVAESGRLLTALAALGLGLVSGLGAAVAFRVLAASSGAPVAGLGQAVGRVGRVLVPLAPGERGKIRIELQGQSVDVIARAEGEALARGDAVVVEEVDGDVALVSRAPEELR
jgi:membrane protein implicated in regulation of membrane protease activity